MLSPMPPIRLFSVTGYDGRKNDIVYCPPAIPTEEHSTVVYFGGDIQDFPQNMKSHRDNKCYIKWNLESTAAMLNVNFPKCHIVIVKPIRMEFKTFSCYTNFVPSNSVGVPDHTPTHHALEHLERLLQNITHRIKTTPHSELREMMSSSLASQQSYMDLDILQVTIEAANNSKVNISPQENTTALLQRELESTRNLTVTTSPYNEHHVTDHHVTITSTHLMDTEGNDKSANTTVIQSPNSSQATLYQCHPISQPNHDDNVKDNDKHDMGTLSNLNPFWWRDNMALDKSNLILIGFSKGCVVLNQFLYEFHYLKTLTPDDCTMMRLVSRISDMYWLDGGHAGGKNTWITSRSLLETLTRLDIKIWIHVTPYQIQDDRRGWIRREERVFTELLQTLGAKVTRTLHFDGGTPDLYMHFQVLNVFRSPEHILSETVQK